MAQDWFVIRSGKEYGPLSDLQVKQQVAAGKLGPDDLIRRADMKNPIKVGSLKGLPKQAPLAVTSAEPADVVPAQPTDKKPIDLKGTWQRLGTPAKIGIGAGGGCLMLLFMCCGGFGLISMIGGSGGGGGSKDTAMKVSASELFQDYKSNEVAADEKYKGKMLEVTGTVHSIGKDIVNTIYVTLEGGGRFEIMSVQCYFSDKHKSEAAQLSKGQTITVRGRCEGKFGNVHIKKCEFVK